MDVKYMFIETQVQNIEDEIAKVVREMDDVIPEDQKEGFLHRLFYRLEGRLIKYT